MNLTVILVIILTTVLFVLNYRMLQMKKNVTNIVDQIVAAHSRDKNFKNQEFLHYYKSNGNIWLSAMEPMFRKSLTLKAAVCVFSIVGALVMIGLAYVEDIYILAVYPFLLLIKRGFRGFLGGDNIPNSIVDLTPLRRAGWPELYQKCGYVFQNLPFHLFKVDRTRCRKSNPDLATVQLGLLADEHTHFDEAVHHGGGRWAGDMEGVRKFLD